MAEYYYMKTGVIVDAAPVIADMQVQLDSGNTQNAKAGDWLVIFYDGSKRIVTAGAFAIDYEVTKKTEDNRQLTLLAPTPK